MDLAGEQKYALCNQMNVLEEGKCLCRCKTFKWASELRFSVSAQQSLWMNLCGINFPIRQSNCSITLKFHSWLPEPKKKKVTSQLNHILNKGNQVTRSWPNNTSNWVSVYFQLYLKNFTTEKARQLVSKANPLTRTLKAAPLVFGCVCSKKHRTSA